MSQNAVERMRAYEADHQPDGYPAVTMQQISELCDVAERYRRALEQIARFGSSDGCQCFRIAREALKIETEEE